MSRDIVYAFPPQWHEAAQDNPTVEIHIGPAGTGKTFNAVRKLLLTSMQQPAIGGVRKAIVLMVRNTYDNLIRSTLKTAEEALIGMDAESTVGNRPSTKVLLPLPDGTRLEFIIEYLAVDRAKSVRALLEGRLFTHAILDEAPTSPRSVLSGMITRLGRYPSQADGGAYNPTIICTANGGYEDNWLCDIAQGRSDALFEELGKRTGRMACGVYWDPPGLIPPSDQREFKDISKWEENPDAVNIDNLPGGYEYYWNMLANIDDDPAFVKMYVVGGFIPRVTGELVFPEFSLERHVIPKDEFKLSQGATIGLSFDFGRRPVCLFWTRTGHGRMVIFDEFAMKNASISDLMAQKVWPAYQTKYGSPIITWATGDPAGLQGGQGFGTSPYEILQAMPYDLPMEPPGLNNRIDVRLDPMHVALSQLGHKGEPLFGVTSNCSLLIASLSKNYIYEKTRGGEGTTRDIPTKIPDNFVSDVADACTYGVLYQTMRRKSAEADRRAIRAAPRRGWKYA